MARSSSTPSPTPAAVPSQGLSGVRGEFVASLGRRIADAKLALLRIRGPKDEALIDFSRRVHMLENSSRLFRFDAMTESLAALTARLPSLKFPQDAREVAALLDRMPELAWTVTPSRLPEAILEDVPLETRSEETNAKGDSAGALLEDDASADDAMAQDDVVHEEERSLALPLVAVAADPVHEAMATAPSTSSVNASIDEVIESSLQKLEAESQPPADVAPLEPGALEMVPLEPASFGRSAIEPAPRTIAELRSLARVDILALGDFAAAKLPWSLRNAENAGEFSFVGRAAPPSIALLDADLAEMDAVLEEWMDDASTEAIPVIVIGSFERPGAASRFIALGAARVLEKPFTRGTLIDAIGEFIPASEEVASNAITTNTENVSAAQDWSPDTNDVLHDISSTLSRIRALVDKPVPARPKALSNVADVAGTRASSSRHAQAHVSLEGRTIVVADHDPGIVWFLGDVLRAQGATVLEATDGTAALELTLKHSPDLLLVDILLPTVDGLALTRLLKQDIVLRDLPVLLLSWKDDLPRRARELGGLADGFLRKESGEGVVLARVREALWRRARFEDRLIERGDVRGRMDGLAPTTLIRSLAKFRPSARLVVEDDVHTLELHVSGGTLAYAARLGPHPIRGRGVVPHFLALRSARFAVLDACAPAEVPNLEGSLEDLLDPIIGRARGAAHALSGHRLFHVEKVDLHLAAATAELAAFPPSARAIAEAIAGGASISEIARTMDLAEIEPVLTFLAWRGLVRGISFSTKNETPPVRTELASAPLLSPTPSPTLDTLASLFSAKSPVPPAQDLYGRTDVDSIYGVSDISPTTARVDVAPLNLTPTPSEYPVEIDVRLTPLAGEVESHGTKKEKSNRGIYIGAAVVAIALVFLLAPFRTSTMIAPASNAPAAEAERYEGESPATLPPVVTATPTPLAVETLPNAESVSPSAVSLTRDAGIAP